MPGTDRRSSTSSDDANAPPIIRQLSQDGTEIIPTRMSKVTAPKPASNPLQFIKVGPCDLYKAAQEQIKKVEEIKKVEKVKDDSEDWQSNLDNWKCSRRKRQEHIIERVVEVKKLEIEEHERNRRRSKTFNEMMEERSSKGGIRKMSILSYPEEDSNDLSDLGISNNKSTDDFSNDNDVQNGNNGLNGSNGHNGRYDDSSTPATTSSPEPEEYTYERAIQGYMSFAETKIKTPIKNLNENSKGVNGNSRISPPKKETGSKIGEKLSELEQIRLRSKSTNDLNGSSENKQQLPKVDINKRRSLFENSDQTEGNSKLVDRVSKELPNTKSIKERLENLEKREESVNKTKVTEEVSASIKDRVSCLEKQKSVETKRLSNGDISTQVSIKERLSSLENKQSEVENKNNKSEDLTEITPIKERVSNLDSSLSKDVAKVTAERDVSFKEKLENFKSTEKNTEIVNNIMNDNNNVNNFNNNCSESEINFHGSLDDKANDNNFERVQTPGEISQNKEETEENDDVVSEKASLEVEEGGVGDDEVLGDEEDDGAGSPSPSAENSGFDIGGKRKTRTRKLTPILASPKVAIAPLKAVCELQIIEEGDNTAVKDDDSDGVIPIHLSPRKCIDGQDMEKFQETSEEELEGSVYTDENIDEVLGKEDDEGTCDEGVTRFDELIEEPAVKEAEIVPQKSSDVKEESDVHEIEKPRQPLPSYENVIISNQVPHLDAPPVSFPLAPVTAIQPPKEKPPPPPLELSDEESTTPELPPKPSVRRLDSTKRIKKEIRKKRSDFLGIEGANDDNYLEPDIYVAPPPDMITFLQEERRLEQQLYRQSICSESDSNHETAESRDSGVELDRGHVDDICWSKPDVLSEPHSRQNSETFGNTSITSEEDEILKKEREIIEVLEKEEQWRYGNKNSNCTEQNDIGEKLAVKLRQLEQEKMQLEWERAEEENRRQAEETARREDEERLKAKEQQLREQETCACNSNPDATSQEALRSERERLQKEQEHLERCRQSLLKQQQGSSEQIDIKNRNNNPHWDTPSTRHSLQEVPVGVPMQDVPRHSMQDVSQPQYTPPQMTSSYRYSLPDLQQRSTRPPPPVPPAKPQRPLTQEQWERETNIKNSRIPSADNIPQQVDSVKLRHGSSVPSQINHGGQQMSRSTLHALSAAPRSRIISNENWMQPKRKADAPKSSYNYQHWLIQEAEHRRIYEQQQRVSQQKNQSRRSLPASYHSSSPSKTYPVTAPSHHTVGLPISPQVHSHQNQKWVSPPRTDKPLPDAVIQTLTQRVQNKTSPRRRLESPSPLQSKMTPISHDNHAQMNHSEDSQQRMLSVSGKKKCSHCNEELGRGAAMIIESLRLFYHIDCFKCCVCHVQLGDGLMGTDVRVRNNKLHCHNCYSSDDELILYSQSEECFFWERIDTLTPVDDLIFPLDLDSEDDEPKPTQDREIFLDETPNWFKSFYRQYQTNENRKFILMQQMHLEMIDYEIRKCELLKEIINQLKN